MWKIKEANQQAGGHWFDPGALRFFRSVVARWAYRGPGGTFFVTSERFVFRGQAHARLYSVRAAIDGGDKVETVGEFQAFSTRARADRAARRYAAEGVPA